MKILTLYIVTRYAKPTRYWQKVQQELHFPDGIYENISNFYEEQVEAEEKR